jgi:outer membrane protein OmpA-like peptidoglycan-associated protein
VIGEKIVMEVFYRCYLYVIVPQGRGGTMKYALAVAVTVLLMVNCGGQKTKLTGLVEVGSIFGFVTDENYDPIGLAQVMIVGDNESMTFTNDAGYFSIDNLAPGSYNILVTKHGYASKNIAVEVMVDELNEQNIVLPQSTKEKGQISGMVVDYVTREPLVVKVTVTDLGMSTMTDSSGHFAFTNLEPRTYLLKIEALQYVTSHSDVAVLPNEAAEIMTSLIKAGTVITLEGIEFEFGKAKIKPESRSVLDDAAAILTNHPEIEVEIQGHTDSIGSEDANRKLSQARAEAVRDYLIDIHMIEPVRLLPIGYGESKPVADNATEVGRAKNRRVDFVVLEE